jgi:hypothetical protein
MRFSFNRAAAYLSVLLMASGAFADTITLATVNVQEPGAYESFAVGQKVGSVYSPVGYWHTIPTVLAGGTLQSFSLGFDPAKANAEEYGKLDFTMTSTGPVWMLTTTRFGGGGDSSGDWLPEVSTQAQLEADGWHVILQGVETETGYGAFGTNPLDNFGWLLFERQSVAGESFSIRTEKYIAPVILQGVATVSSTAVPAPAGATAGSLLLVIFGLYRAVRSPYQRGWELSFLSIRPVSR